MGLGGADSQSLVSICPSRVVGPLAVSPVSRALVPPLGGGVHSPPAGAAPPWLAVLPAPGASPPATACFSLPLPSPHPSLPTGHPQMTAINGASDGGRGGQG